MSNGTGNGLNVDSHDVLVQGDYGFVATNSIITTALPCRQLLGLSVQFLLAVLKFLLQLVNASLQLNGLLGQFLIRLDDLSKFPLLIVNGYTTKIKNY